MAMQFSGHLGRAAADLVDGRLAPAAEERAWHHVLSCPGCRRLVELEGWAKSQLSALRAPSPYDAPRPGDVPVELIGALRQLDDLDEWIDDEPRSRVVSRKATLAVVGAGSLGAAVLGLATLSSPPALPGEPTKAPASIRSAVPGPTGQGVTDNDRLRRTTR